MKPFELAQELFGHTADVRCACVLEQNASDTSIVTGSRDRSLRLWRRNTESDQYEQVLANYEDHPHWINALVALSTTTGGVVTGCHDKLIRVFNLNLQMLYSLGGHTGPVASLTMLTPTLLASGSWDGSCRLWDLDVRQCKQIFDNQENSVAVLALNSNTLVCGSAGRAEGNVIVDSTIRVFDLSNNASVKAQFKPHDGPIRCLAKCARDSQFAFCSTSNDGSVILYSADFKPQQRLVNPPGFEGAPAFVYCATAGLSAPELLCTACDDCVVRVWEVASTMEIVQEIEHPSTVWWVSALKNGDLVTMGGDGVVRVFSQTRSCSTSAEFQSTARAAREAQRNKVSPPMDVSKLVRIEQAPVDGVKDQHVQVFNKNGIAVAYQFTEGAWVEIGQVMGGTGEGKDEMDGELYDKVVPVEIADEVNGGVKRLKIGFNYNDNPFVVANAFIKDNQLPDFYLDQIVDFIKQNTPAGVQQQQQAPAAAVVQRCFPLAVGITFEKGNASKAVQKLKESISSAADAQELDRILEVLNATSRYHATQFTPAQILLICDRLVNTLPLQDRFPAYDLLRAMLLHPNCAEQLVTRPDMCKQVFAQALLTAALPNAPNALVLCCLRAACNMFRNSAAIGLILQACGDASTAPLEALGQSPAVGSGDASVRLAVASLYCNVTSVMVHKQTKGDRDRAVLAQSFRTITSLLQQHGGDDGETGLRCIQTLGNIALIDPQLIDKTKLTAPGKRAEWQQVAALL